MIITDAREYGPNNVKGLCFSDCSKKQIINRIHKLKSLPCRRVGWGIMISELLAFYIMNSE